MFKQALAAAACVLAAVPAVATEGTVPRSPFGHLDHVFVIMMENRAADQIVGAAATSTPFINAYAAKSNLATNYWAVGHPSLTNYLEVVGGSNFGVINDFWPNWTNGGCVDYGNTGGCANPVTPIAGTGLDYAFPATVDACQLPWFNQLGPLPQCATPGAGSAIVANNWGNVDYPAAYYTAKTIAHQLVENGRDWKSYQQSLPTMGSAVDGVNYADGDFSNLSQPWPLFVTNAAGVSVPATVQKRYAVKHNPFVYFADVQTGTASSGLSLAQTVPFEGKDGLYADLARGSVPAFSWIVPDQCHDMHSAGGGTAECANGTDTLLMGDAAVERLVTAIKGSPAWKEGRNAIVVLWDENDYGNAADQVALIVDTNYGSHGVRSGAPYNHYSLTRTIEAAFGLRCLNHACDSGTAIMSDLFGGGSRD